MKVPRKTKVIRSPKRGFYDKETIYSILDNAFLCHVSFVHDGYPIVIPTLFGRDKNKVLIHGSQASRMLKNLRQGVNISIAVTNVHGIVLARSAYHHSINYESVVLFGKAFPIEDQPEKIEALKVISDHILHGRWEDARFPNQKELNATLVMQLEIDEASAKIRTGDPVDEDEDYDLDVWAGILPVKQGYDAPIDDSKLKPGVELPGYLKDFMDPME